MKSIYSMTPKSNDDYGCISLTKSAFAIVDAIDADLTEMKWHTLYKRLHGEFARFE